MTYQLGENNFMCKCTYELELEIQPSRDEIVSMVKQVRKEMAEERAKGEVITLCECDCMKSGEIRERERIIKLFKPYSYHDEMCYYEGKRICYPEDCSAEMYSSVIREILKTDNQENLHEL